ncbi:NAD-dependent epimerase/dehydratase family protein [Parafilimonas sp.]|uniref:NAD-dependent epimerase/dehydratase family protein n=1 Tax=Parafilimonas sp. TaxID=1969739 RepID=UPI0039E6DE8C
MIFITGATGLLGSCLTKMLTGQESGIKALYRTEIPFHHPAVEWVQGDLFDVVLLEEIMQGVDEVYHCAGKISYNPKDKRQLFKTNAEGTANIVNAALHAGVRKLLHVSSVSALGRIRENTIITEEMQWTSETSNSVYGESKYLAEMEVWRGMAEGLNAVIVNPSIILGAGNWNSGSSEIFKTIYKEFPYYSDGLTGFVDVEDVAKAMIALMQNNISGERFILSAENTGYKNLFDLIAAAFHKKAPSKKITPFMAGVVWRLEALKSSVTGKTPFITKETARTALAKIYFDNSKLLKALPAFSYTPLQKSVERICNELLALNNIKI